MVNRLRALDLTDYRGWLAGKILAETGCEVIKIEKPGGDPGRRLGPYYQGDSDPQKSLLWFAYNTSKKGITLDIEKADGRELFKRLANTADFVLESFPPGYLDKTGLGFSALSKTNPGIILTSITPFGQNGPYRDFKEAHIVILALSGLMNILGDPDRPPVQTGFPLVYAQASGQAATATMIAYYARERDGKGQHVDVSMHNSGAMWCINAVPLWHLMGGKIGRAGQHREGRTIGGANPRYIWPCQDGFVSFTVGGGPVYTKSLQLLINWMTAEGMTDDFLKSRDWTSFDMATVTEEGLRRVEEPIIKFFLARKKAELSEESLKRGIMLFPVVTISELAESPQLKERNFWAEIDHQELNTTIRYPGFFAQTSNLPCHVKHRAPLTGEHNKEIYQLELGLTEKRLRVLRRTGVI
ncbi:CaiB/BaiF CoA transferase family protein [Chloroflexota bacterium]